MFSLLDRLVAKLYYRVVAYEKIEALRQRVIRKQRILARLRLASTRLTEAQLERTWAIVAAHDQGLTIRQIASATGLSATRVHQLLTTHDAHDIPRWLSDLREGDGSIRAYSTAG